MTTPLARYDAMLRDLRAMMRDLPATDAMGRIGQGWSLERGFVEIEIQWLDQDHPQRECSC